MRYKIFKIVATIFSELAGVACLVVAFFAFQLGLDNNITLGMIRKILAGVGGFLVALPLLIFFFSRFIRHNQPAGLVYQKTSRWAQWFKSANSVNPENETKSRISTFFNEKPLFWSAVGMLIVLLCSVWYMTSGLMIHFRGYSNLFDLQADVTAPPAGRSARVRKSFRRYRNGWQRGEFWRDGKDAWDGETECESESLSRIRFCAAS